jgi:hypothetical protein
MSEIITTRPTAEPLHVLVEQFGDMVAQSRRQYTEAKALVQRMYLQAQYEHVTASELRQMIKDTLKSRNISTRTAYRYMPPSVKDQQKRMNRLNKEPRQLRQIDQMTQAPVATQITTVVLPPRLFVSLYNSMKRLKSINLLIDNGVAVSLEVPDIDKY